ncbi:hypothetical protein CLOM_g3425 [Closterium sp. NIES-68]|nr:hypothetical protein CLOM_g3425 [Closterium sp. NIES-68]GJP65736.1 hypothetical protein CLOP_g22599 [Closterium sp. NIES-67]
MECGRAHGAHALHWTVAAPQRCLLRVRPLALMPLVLLALHTAHCLPHPPPSVSRAHLAEGAEDEGQGRAPQWLDSWLVKWLGTLANGSWQSVERRDGGAEELGSAARRSVGGARRWLKRRAVKPNLVVAQDGTGDVTTLREAAAIINGVAASQGWFVVRIRAGVYADKVDIARPMVALIGDGPTRTVITGSRSNADGFATWDTATFSSSGASFAAADIRFENTAGPYKEAGVAFRATGDMAVLYRCHFAAFQDTLNPHSGRQYYRECRVEGALDFIFGRDGAAVFHRSRIDVRKWTGVQGFLGRSIITANGRTTRSGGGGFVFVDCAINARDPGAKAVLGRPWKAYARVVFVNTYMSNVIEPAGWASWPGKNFRAKPFLAEAGSYGPGARRAYADWVHPGRLGARHVAPFMPDPFIQAASWVQRTPLSIPYP